MENVNIAALSVTQLQELQNSIPGEIRRKQNAARNNVIREIRELAKSHGFTLEDLFPPVGAASTPRTRERGSVAPKYRNPNNFEETWTGRGRKPKWVESWLESGKSIPELEIPAGE